MENKSIKKEVILNLIQDLQRLLLSFINGVRGRFQIKFGMTQLYNLGFTLIELLVVVVIIAILAAVAVPQYKKAALKSRFSKVMPVAKSIVEAQEVYYLGKNFYAANDEKDLLDVAPSGDTTIELASRDQENQYNYVAASSTEVPGARYIMYQKHSPNFAENIHCEALDTDSDATWLCRDGLHGTPVETGEIKSLNGAEYTTYVLSGRTIGSTFDRTCEGEVETTTQPCSGGCGIMSATPECDPYTGQWKQPVFNPSSCPVQPPDETASCPSGSGVKTRKATCNAAGTAYEYKGAWDESACCTGTPPSITGSAPASSICTGRSSITGSNPICVNGEWKFKSFSSNLTCGASTTTMVEGCASNAEGATNGGVCTGTYNQGASCRGQHKFGCAGSTFYGTKTNGTGTGMSYCYGDSEYGCANSYFHALSDGKAGCQSNKAYGCAGSWFEGIPVSTTNVVCSGSAAYACADSTFSRQAHCYGDAANACSGSTFTSNAYCQALKPGGCDDTNYDGGCCTGSYCPSGSPKCKISADGKTVTINGTW